MGIILTIVGYLMISGFMYVVMANLIGRGDYRLRRTSEGEDGLILCSSAFWPIAIPIAIGVTLAKFVVKSVKENNDDN